MPPMAVAPPSREGPEVLALPVDRVTGYRQVARRSSLVWRFIRSALN
jgi:hypothetical protein